MIDELITADNKEELESELLKLAKKWNIDLVSKAKIKTSLEKERIRFCECKNDHLQHCKTCSLCNRLGQILEGDLNG